MKILDWLLIQSISQLYDVGKENDESEANTMVNNKHWNSEGNTIDFSKIKVTEYKTNGRIYAPRPGRRDQEIMLEEMKDKYVQIGNDFIENQNKKPTNISNKATNGMNKLKRIVKNGELVIGNSDKSRKTVVMNKDLYEEIVTKHTKKDKEVSYKQVRKVGKKVNHRTKIKWNEQIEKMS